MIFQDPFASLNPRHKVGDIIAAGPIAYGTQKNDAIKRAQELLQLVGLDPAVVDRYPHEFSGGQRQRIGIARALALKPALIVADEPVSMIDASLRISVVNLLRRLRDEMGMSIIYITHDLATAYYISDRIIIMRKGQVVESGDARTVLDRPQHPYSIALKAAVLSPDGTNEKTEVTSHA